MRVTAARVAPAVIAALAVHMLTLWGGAASAQGRKHALLVGVGDYQDEQVRDLQGPPHDARGLRDVLVRDWGFDRRDVTVLLDGAATRAAILGALDALIRDTRSGDYVFIFFSGHGTSSEARRGRLAASLDPGTGGLYPADLDLESGDAYAQLIVGRRDLQPRFLALDRDREVFVVFDACYSGNTVRNFFANGSPKYQPWPGDRLSYTTATTAFVEDYPYSNLLYLSASAENEMAWDIPLERLPRSPTIDGLPHGALTDALLRGLAGDANTDGNGELTVRELHAYARRSLEGAFQQTPQLLHPRGRPDTPDRPVFRVARSAQPTPTRGSRELRVLLGDGADVMRGPLDRVDGVSFSTSAYDLRLDVENPDIDPVTFSLRHGSGDVLASGIGVDDVVRRVEWQTSVHALLTASFPDQNFNVRLDILDTVPAPNSGGGAGLAAVDRTNAELVVGRTYEMRYEADVDAYFLLVTVDVRGDVRLLAPWTEADLQAQRAVRIPDLTAQPPTGTEFVKLFAFRRRPSGLEAWMPVGASAGRPEVRVIESERDMDALLRFVRGSAAFAAETTRKFPTRR